MDNQVNICFASTAAFNLLTTVLRHFINDFFCGFDCVNVADAVAGLVTGMMEMCIDALIKHYFPNSDIHIPIMYAECEGSMYHNAFEISKSFLTTYTALKTSGIVLIYQIVYDNIAMKIHKSSSQKVTAPTKNVVLPCRCKSHSSTIR